MKVSLLHHQIPAVDPDDCSHLLSILGGNLFNLLRLQADDLTHSARRQLPLHKHDSPHQQSSQTHPAAGRLGGGGVMMETEATPTSSLAMAAMLVIRVLIRF